MDKQTRDNLNDIGKSIDYNKIREWVNDMDFNAEQEQARRLLGFLQNIDDKEDAVNFVRIWLYAINNGLGYIDEEPIDKKEVLKQIADVDTRFKDVTHLDM